MVRAGDRVSVRVELARGARLKRRTDGRIDFVSPLACPFVYGAVPGERSGDGDPLDAVVLGVQAGPGQLLHDLPVVGVVRFVDCGHPDDKLICSAQPFGDRQRAQVQVFFQRYARAKRWLARLRRQPGPTAFEGWTSRARSALGSGGGAGDTPVG